MVRFILDTNALISLFESKNRNISKRLDNAILNEDEISTTILNYYELLRGLDYTTNAKYRKKIKHYVDKIFTVISTINLKEADCAAGIHQKVQKKIKGKKGTPSDVDIIMAAIALSLNATIVSCDNDFNLIGVKVQNWEK